MVLQSLKQEAVLMLGKALSKKVADLHAHINFEDTYQPYKHEQINFVGINSPRRIEYDKTNPAFKKLINLIRSR